MQKSIEKTMHLGIDFWKDFGGLLEAKWKHVGTKIENKSMPTSKRDFLKTPCFSLGKTMILRVQGIEVGRKNQWKIDQKMESRWEGILASIFSGLLVDFWRQVGKENGAKIDPRRHRKSDGKMEGTKMATRCE